MLPSKYSTNPTLRLAIAYRFQLSCLQLRGPAELDGHASSMPIVSSSCSPGAHWRVPAMSSITQQVCTPNLGFNVLHLLAA